jgi:hypothetical protein
MIIFATFFFYFADSHNVFAQSSSSLTNPLTYSNPTDKVSIKYPSNWEKDETDYAASEDRTKTIVSFYSSFENHLDPYRESLTVSEDEGLFYDADLDEYLAETIDAYKSEPALDFKLLQSNTTSTLSGNPAYALTYTSILEAQNKGEENGTLKSYEIGTLVNNTAYYITFDAEESVFDTYFPIVQEMIDTFTINASPSSVPTETQTNQIIKPTIPVGFSEYVNTGYKIKMVYPSNWQDTLPPPEEVQKGKLVTFISPQRSMLDQFQEFVELWVYDSDMASPVNMQDYLNDAISGMSEESELINSSANYMLAGKPAIKVEYRTIGEDGNKIQGMTVATIVDNKAYILKIAAEPATYSEYLPVMEKIINSFEIQQKSLGTGARASNVAQSSTPFIELFQIEWLTGTLSVHIVVNQDTQEQASRYLPVVEKAVNRWSNLLKQYSGNYNAWNFNVSSSVGYLDTLGPNASKDIIIEITGDPQAVGCNQYSGSANVYHEDLSTGIPTVIITSCTDEEGNVEDYPEDNVYSTALHEFAHTLGLGHAFNMDGDLMCSSDQDHIGNEITTCTDSGREEPSEADIMALLYKYGTDGFSQPNRELVGYRPVYEPGTSQLCIEGKVFNEETQTCEPTAGDTTELPVEEPITIECAEGETFRNATGTCEPQPYTTYTNETLGIEFQYPNDWTLNTEDLAIGYLYVNVPNLEKGISITKYDNEEMEGMSDLQTFTEEMLQLELDTYKDLGVKKIEDPKIISIGNLEMGTFKEAYKLEEDPKPTTFQFWTTIVDGQGYVVVFYAPTSTFNSTEVSQIRDHIIQSFKILNVDKTTTISPTDN